MMVLQLLIRWRRRWQRQSFALSLFLYFVCFYVYRATVLWSRATILWSHSVERNFSTSESSLGFFSPSFIDPRFTELVASGAAALYGFLHRKRRRGKRAGALVKVGAET
ncbi:hypothetical protein AMECASPLE_015058 [Ameca splendens]|uniref:Uncharacterized protein n=1 Tax=Ameca splendens TaxID=208324 RepID=A0ABV0ZNP3_9TELE